ncbi:hypothetical protein F0562_010168 [Nyssa sinensis]|uniref:Uncharacterized protein n=1 Tax=Nyssa sinensis TaxID=561372 RepID=A0A5J4ZY40_9ASTE|nr:hypothetical protein F0562_010168 [Nyssa sinensis]
MDVAAGILSIEAEIARNKAVIKTRLGTIECRGPSHKAFKLGLVAVVLLGLAHLLANLFGGCMCICSPEEFENSSAKRQISLACLVLSWITMAVGFPMVIIGTLANSKSKASQRVKFSDVGCDIPELKGDNFKMWKERVLLHLGWMDIDYAIRKDKPPTVTDTSTEADIALYEHWE